MALLDAEHAAFVQGAVSINAASRADDHEPVLSRVHGCRVANGRVRLLFCGSKSAALLEAIRTSRTIAVVFSEPRTHRTIQLKGTDAAVVASAPEDAHRAARYVSAIAAEFEALGYGAGLAETVLACRAEDLVAVQFTPCAAFSQTPGPRAGEPLRLQA